MKKNIISFMNMKGGVGKTTLCVNLADCLSKHFGLNVLVIDLDPQFNATQYLMNHEHYLKNIFEEEKTVKSIFKTKKIDSNVLNGTILPGEEMIECHIENISNNFDLICGDLKMTELDGNLSKLEKRLKKYIINKELRDKYDFIFIDCPPTQSLYTTAAFNASDYYILPVKPDFLSILGINLFQTTINSLNDTEHRLECLGMVFTLVQEYPYIKNKMDELRERYPFYTFEKSMKQSTEVLQNAEKHVCLYSTSFKSDIIDLSKEFIERYEESTGEVVVDNAENI